MFTEIQNPNVTFSLFFTYEVANQTADDYPFYAYPPFSCIKNGLPGNFLLATVVNNKLNVGCCGRVASFLVLNSKYVDFLFISCKNNILINISIYLTGTDNITGTD